jgi:catechol 2,3-dioxygenase-like lactoylglutathione lyase family enzyme
VPEKRLPFPAFDRILGESLNHSPRQWRLKENTMSSPQVSTKQQSVTGVPVAATVDLKLEVIALPVSDIDRAKAFYGGLGWALDADFMIGDFRGVQMTPPGSPCSIHLSTTAAPGSAQGMFLVVSDIEAARNELIARGVDVREVFHFDGDHRPVPGPDPKLPSYGSYASFSDPDGNRWVLQQVTTRLPGRGLSNDVETLTALFQETEQRHGGRTPDEAAADATRHIERALGAQA